EHHADADGERASHRCRERRARQEVEPSRAVRVVIAITGARGYLGAALCDALSRSGHRVRRLTRAPDGVRGDAFFSLDEGCSDGALAGVETLIHAAHDMRPRREDELRRVNVEGSRRLLAAA